MYPSQTKRQQTPEWKAYNLNWQRNNRDKLKITRDRYRATEKSKRTTRIYLLKKQRELHEEKIRKIDAELTKANNLPARKEQVEIIE